MKYEVDTVQLNPPSFSCSLCFCLPQLCQAKGFVCEFCGNDKDIVFPFQLNKCQRCEGEPSLLVASLGGLKAPLTRPSTTLSWRDWKFPNPRRLARALSQDRREGEGGEEGLELEEDEERIEGIGNTESGEQEEKGEAGEESGDMKEVKRERGGIFRAFNSGRLVKALSRSKGNEEDETIEGKEAEKVKETELQKEGEGRGTGRCGEVDYHKDEKSELSSNEHSRREKRNLLKALHIDRITKNIYKRDRTNSATSDSETWGSVESLDEVGKDRKGSRKVSGFGRLAKGFLKREEESGGEGKTELKEEECDKGLFEKGENTEGERKVKAGENNEMPGKDTEKVRELAVTGKTESGTVKAEKLPGMGLFKHPKLSNIFSRERDKREEDTGGERQGTGEVDTEGEGQDEPESETQNKWRARKTRKARRVSKGRKMGERTEQDDKTEERDDACIEGGAREKNEQDQA